MLDTPLFFSHPTPHTQPLFEACCYPVRRGSLSSDSTTLFYRLQELGLDRSQIATFLAHPDLRNILGRVVGSKPSIVDSLIQIIGDSPNLLLMNPAGIVFGPNASLNVPGSFKPTRLTAFALLKANSACKNYYDLE